MVKEFWRDAASHRQGRHKVCPSTILIFCTSFVGFVILAFCNQSDINAVASCVSVYDKLRLSLHINCCSIGLAAKCDVMWKTFLYYNSRWSRCGGSFDDERSWQTGWTLDHWHENERKSSVLCAVDYRPLHTTHRHARTNEDRSMGTGYSRPQNMEHWRHSFLPLPSCFRAGIFLIFLSRITYTQCIRCGLLSTYQLLYRLSRDNLKHFYLPKLSHHFKLLSHICVPCPRSYFT